jgi:hypothetical protein
METPLKKILDSRGLSLYRFQKMTGIPYATLHGLTNEPEKLTSCSASTLYLIATTLNVTMESFFEDGFLHLPRRFADCFWDVDMRELRRENIPFVIARLFDYGGLDGIRYAESRFTKEEMIATAKTRRDFSPVVANYFRQHCHLDKQEMVYYRLGGGADWKKEIA